MTINFNENLKTGIYSIDKQHKELFEHVNNLYNACINGSSKEEVENMIEFLDNYVYLHFMTEESYMEKYSYPGMNSHKAAHNIFRDSFNGIKAMFDEEGATANLILKLNKTLINWLIMHYRNEDKQLAEHVLLQTSNK